MNRLALTLAVLLALSGCATTTAPEATPSVTAEASTEIVTATPEPFDPLVTFPDCRSVTVVAPSYDAVLVATAGGETERFNASGGEATFHTDAVVSEVLVIDGERSAGVVNPGAGACQSTPTPTETPTPTPTPEPTPTATPAPEPLDYLNWESSNDGDPRNVSSSVLVSFWKDRDDDPDLRVTYSVYYWTEESDMLRPWVENETVVVRYDEAETRRHWVDPANETFEMTDVRIEKVEFDG